MKVDLYNTRYEYKHNLFFELLPFSRGTCAVTCLSVEQTNSPGGYVDFRLPGPFARGDVSASFSGRGQPHVMTGHPIVWALVEQERRKSLMLGKS